MRPAGPVDAAGLVAVAAPAAGRVAVARMVAPAAAVTHGTGMASGTVAVAKALVAMRGMPRAAPLRRTPALLVQMQVPAKGSVRRPGRISRVVSAAAVEPVPVKAANQQARASAALPGTPLPLAATRALPRRGWGRALARTPVGRTHGLDRAGPLTLAMAPPVGRVDAVGVAQAPATPG